jgi:hypothetical protein
MAQRTAPDVYGMLRQRTAHGRNTLLPLAIDLATNIEWIIEVGIREAHGELPASRREHNRSLSHRRRRRIADGPHNIGAAWGNSEVYLVATRGVGPR